MVVELQEQRAADQRVIAEQAATIVELRAEVARLRRLVGTDSSNSGLPSSKDRPGTPPRKRVVSSRESSGKKRGGQDGHEGHRLERVAEPDRREVHRPRVCAGCGTGLAEDAAACGSPVLRQVFDVPQPRLDVTEHELLAVACGCGHVTRAAGPAGVTGPVQYGPRVVAAAVYLQVAQMLPVGRCAQALADLLGARVSTGFAAAAVQRAASAVAGANKVIAEKIADHTGAAFFDESATKIAGKEHWFHVAATEHLTAYHADSGSRKVASMTAAGILPVFRGVAVHDALTSYFNVELTPHVAAHQLCWAHLDRALKALTLFDPEAKADGWAKDLRDLMGDILRWRITALDADAERLPRHKHDEATDRWDALLARAEQVHLHIDGRDGGQSDARRLVARLTTRRAAWLYFLGDLVVEPWNNVAERAVRMIKTKTKVSGGFGALSGLQTFLSVRGYLDTLRKNARNLLDGLIAALNGHAWTPA